MNVYCHVNVIFIIGLIQGKGEAGIVQAVSVLVRPLFLSLSDSKHR